jgi:hypothetical protein
MVNGHIASTPSFAGANPADVRDGPQQGTRLLAAQEDTARALLTSLDAAQQRRALFSPQPLRDIVTGNRVDVSPLTPEGLPAAAMTAAQREQLMRVIDAYAAMMTEEVAAARLARIRGAGPERITFGWAGGTARGQQHYYRVQGPTFLIEFDNTQNNGNHIHSVWRDFSGDFGRDLLREHITASH